MDMEKLVNQTDTHKSYGKGIIRKADEKVSGSGFYGKGKSKKVSLSVMLRRFSGFGRLRPADRNNVCGGDLEGGKRRREQ